jgi:hypothetical protein
VQRTSRKTFFISDRTEDLIRFHVTGLDLGWVHRSAIFVSPELALPLGGCVKQCLGLTLFRAAAPPLSFAAGLVTSSLSRTRPFIKMAGSAFTLGNIMHHAEIHSNRVRKSDTKACFFCFCDS